MSAVFSPDKKFTTWRALWIALAEAEKELGLDITDEQIAELKAHKDDINYEVAEAREKEVRHDVMSHVYAYGVQCPKAKGIIHLGATSAYVGDNTDIIQIREALTIVKHKLADLLSRLASFAMEYKDLPTLGFTHFQPAQLTTVGKRATLWMQDFYFDYLDVCELIDGLMMLGVKGTTGTQASFLDLFDGDHEKVKELDRRVVQKMGFEKSIPVSGQTYTRKVDFKVLSVLSGIAQSAHKMTNDIRLLQHLKEVEEPFEKKQIGSSAMAYKRNPMRSERIASLSRYVMSNIMSASMTASTQWFERTLDDSANRRLILPESFMAVDAVLDIAVNVCSGLVVYKEVIRKHVMQRNSVYGYGKYHHGIGEKRRRSSGAPRGDPGSFHGGRPSGQRVRKTERPSGAHRKGPYVRPQRRGRGKTDRTFRLYRTFRPADGGIHRGIHPSRHRGQQRISRKRRGSEGIKGV